MVNDDLRPEYRREDFGAMVRGKYAHVAQESSNIIVLDPEIAEAFPNTKAVNDALRGLLEFSQGQRTSSRAIRLNVRTGAPSLTRTACRTAGRQARFAIMGEHSRRGGLVARAGPAKKHIERRDEIGGRAGVESTRRWR